MNGIRRAFVYAENVERLGAGLAPQRDIWPEFLDEAGALLPICVPLIGDFNAVMRMVFDNMVEVHFQRLAFGNQVPLYGRFE